ncbi:MAG: hypothetical protein WAK44_25010, partial [Trebonia sp.]
VRHSSVKRVASAVGEGSIAIQLIQTLLADKRLGAGRPPETAAPMADGSPPRRLTAQGERTSSQAE